MPTATSSISRQHKSSFTQRFKVPTYNDIKFHLPVLLNMYNSCAPKTFCKWINVFLDHPTKVGEGLQSHSMLWLLAKRGAGGGEETVSRWISYFGLWRNL